MSAAMAELIKSRCPHCKSILRTKNRKLVGQEVTCPKCDQPFVIRMLARKPHAEGAGESPQLPKRRSTRDPKPIDKKRKLRNTEPEEANSGPFAVISTIIWLNASIATAVCLLDCAIDLFYMVTHFGDMQRQLGVGRLVVRQVGRPIFVAIVAGGAWWHSVWPRDINTRGVAVVFGAGFVLLFGLVGAVTAALGNAAFGNQLFSIQWSAVYLGVSLLLFAFLGYGPESPTQRAERLMSNGRFYDALEVVQRELEKDPDNIGAIKLEQTLREIIGSR